MTHRVLALIVLLLSVALRAGAAEKPNVLFIAIDDLNDWVGPLGGHPQARTPNMDRLAARGTLFANAHTQAPLCNPSRTSLLTGLRPSSTGIYGLSPGLRRVPITKDVVSLPQHFHNSGYFTFNAGKIFHDGSIRYPADNVKKAPGKDAAKNAKNQAKKAAAAVGNNEPFEFEKFGDRGGGIKPDKKFVKTPDDLGAMDWGPFPEQDSQTPDWHIADSAIDALKTAPKDRPFFICAGFRLPHVPCYAPQKWFDLFPLDKLQMPPVKIDDRDDVPEFSWYLNWKLPEPRLKWLQDHDIWVSLVRSYLASTTFMDSQIGRLLDTLKETGHENDTLVVLWSDHGWHVGEKLMTGKNTLWERSTHVPLIFAGPGVPAGQRVTSPAELLDIYPTLIDLAGLPKRDGLEGHSLLPQIKDPKAPRPWPAITTHNAGNHGIRTEQYRYIRYADGSEELYDIQKDPNEWTNLAKDPKFAAVIKEHAQWLPKDDKPAAQFDAPRSLVKKDGQWYWEGKPIQGSEKSQ